MPSIISGYEYDIFISYRQNDNKRDGWVTEFINTLQDELDATLKEKVNIYFDENPHDGLLDLHDVDRSLAKKLKCLILIPIVSQTYCDPNCFAWQHEFIAFRDLASVDQFGIEVNLPNGNVASRILPIKIHELDPEDISLYEKEVAGVMRAVDFIYNEPGVNRPLRPSDEHADSNQNKVLYLNQINKVANGIKEVLRGLRDVGSANNKDVRDEPKNQTQHEKVQLTAELKRRNILRVCITYILTAVIFWKVSEIIIGLLELSDSLMQLVTLLLIVFFPIAITFAWLYEISPKGFIRAGSASSQHNPFSSGQKKPLTSNTFIGTILFTIAALYFFFPHNAEVDLSKNVNNIQKSIAVLPFVNMSNDPEQEYFSDGISEELINALAKIPDLKVSGRTSSFSFKGKNENMKEIGKQLGVTSILVGSVRKSGTTIRINAQLINVEDGFHLWTETFDRELNDIFAIQDEITAAIINALKVHLIDEKTIEKSKSINIEAYSIYLKARQKLALRGIDNLIESRNFFNQVIAIDSTYSPAYSGLGRALSLLVNYSSVDLSFNDSYRLATQAANKALELDLNNGEAYSVLGTVKSWNNWDWEIAEQNFLKSVELSPNDAEMYNFIGDYYNIVYDAKLAIEMESKALELDPIHAVNHIDLAATYAEFGDWENGIKYYKSGLALDSSFITSIGYLLVECYSKLGILEELEDKFNNLNIQNASETQILSAKILLALAKGQYDEALSYVKPLAEFSKNGLFSSAFVAEFYVELKMYNEASYWVERAYQDRDIYLVFQSRFSLPENLPDHPALQAALDKPEWNTLYEIRRQNLKLNAGN